MTRARTLRPQFFSSFNLAKVDRDTRLFFAGLWVEADDDGRIIDSPKQLAGAIFPHDEDVDAATVSRWIDALAAIGVVKRYQAGSGRYLIVANFAEHQKPPHPTPSKLPAPHAKRVSDSRRSRETLANSTRGSPESVTPLGGDAHSLGLGLGLGSSQGFTDVGPCLGSGPPSNVHPGSAAAEGGDGDVLLRNGGTGPAGLAGRLAAACQANDRSVAQVEAAAVVIWALRSVDERVVEEAIGWAEAKASTATPVRLPRGVAATIEAKARDRGIVMTSYDPHMIKEFA